MSPPLEDVARSIARLKIRDDTLLVSSGDSVLATQRDGFIEPDEEHGLFVHETRMLSLYRCRIGRQRPFPAALSNVRQDRWMGYYIVRAPGQDGTGSGGGVREATQQALELRITRVVGEGMREDIDLANHTAEPTAFRLAFEVDADFADLEETNGERKQKGVLKRSWKAEGERGGQLCLDYRAEHRYRHQGHRGTARIQRSITLHVVDADSPPSRRGRRIWFDIELPPRGRWHACFDWRIAIDGRTLDSPRCAGSGDEVGTGGEEGASGQIGDLYLEEATCFETPESTTLSPVVIEALTRAREDLAALRLQRLDHGKRAWTVTAGLPMFLALFGRDSLTAAWQSALLGPEVMRGTLPALADTQGTRDDPWRDERPGRILHEAHTGPLGALWFNPKARDYFSLTSSGLFPFVVAQLWQWTADREAVGPMLEPALRALQWLDTHARNEQGFYAITTRSKQGMANQTWKDSSDSLVHEDGSLAEQPVAACEEQAMVYAAKLGLAGVLRGFGRADEAGTLEREAGELQKRFNDAYWMDDLGFLAMGLDPRRGQIRSIASNALHCMALGIVDQALAPRLMQRLFKPDMFSGWGIRTLSSDHPAYNPYAYHRGTIWPVEHGPFAVGGYRYGCHAEAERVCAAMFQAAALFEYRRLPECFAGHPRDDDHPFPGIYPAANVPQAWSASTVVTMLQAMLGLYPHAPSGVLFLDPRLPEWLPGITLRHLRVGDATLDLRFRRDPDGATTAYEVLDQRGELEVRRRSIPFGADL